MRVRKPIQWFAKYFKKDYNSIKKIIEYLNIEDVDQQYCVTETVNQINNFFKQNKDSRSFFTKYTRENNFNKFIETNDSYISLNKVLELIGDDLYWVLILYLKDKNIKKYHFSGKSFITKEDYNIILKDIDYFKNYDINSDIRYNNSEEGSLLNYIKSIYKGDIILHDRKLLGNNKEIDFLIPDLKIAIEFNGLYWHSDLRIEDKNYHLNKSKLCEEKGYRLIHIYEHEWVNINNQEKIKSFLNIAFNHCLTKIYARNCVVRKITNKEAKPFSNKTHLQGHRDASITYGLFYKDELVQLMSFSKTTNAKRNGAEWEIIRGCPGSNNIVIGGVSKLFKHFIKEYNPEGVFSYCDFNKFNGKSYEALGMKFIGYTGPDFKWIMPGGVVINRCPNKHKELQEKSIGKLYGAGSKKYLWKKD